MSPRAGTFGSTEPQQTWSGSIGGLMADVPKTDGSMRQCETEAGLTSALSERGLTGPLAQSLMSSGIPGGRFGEQRMSLIV